MKSGHVLLFMAKRRRCISLTLKSCALIIHGIRSSIIAAISFAVMGSSPKEGAARLISISIFGITEPMTSSLDMVWSMFKAGVPHGKAVVMPFDLCERNKTQGNLLTMAAEDDAAKRNARMASLDAANHRYGRGTVKCAVEGLGKGVWALKQDHKSHSCTTGGDELADRHPCAQSQCKYCIPCYDSTSVF